MTTPDAPSDPARDAVDGDRSTLRRRFVWSLVLAVLVYAALILLGDIRALGRTLAGFPWRWLPAVLALTLLNYGGRLVKWHWYLRLVGVPSSLAESTRVFGAGMTMVLTPGKVGELLKSYMVRNTTGTPIAVTAPIVLAERLTDGLAMLMLAGLGLYAFDDPRLRLTAVVVLAALLAVVVVVQVRPLALALLGLARRMPIVGRFATQMEDFYESSYLLFRPGNLLIAVVIGLISWTGEGLAYYLVLVGLGATSGMATALQAVFIFSISTVIGAVVATPGGLGGTEGSLVALSTQLLGLTATVAAAAALLVRFATLWFGVGLGLISLALWPELLEEPAVVDG